MAEKKPDSERSGEEYNQYVVNTPDNMNKQAKDAPKAAEMSDANMSDNSQPIAKAEEEGD